MRDDGERERDHLELRLATLHKWENPFLDSEKLSINGSTRSDSNTNTTVIIAASHWVRHSRGGHREILSSYTTPPLLDAKYSEHLQTHTYGKIYDPRIVIVNEPLGTP